LGVIKVGSKEEAIIELTKLFKKSDMVICQEFLYSEFDWRVGVLDNKPLFACKYYMSKNHWQIYNWNGDDHDKEGDSETLPVEDVPDDILQTALKAASLIGDGLYGVDLKLVEDKVYVVEVNDNPNIDFGVEDMVLKDTLYETLIGSFINRIEIEKNIRKINFANN
jgi:glutathione synthase/RimK-type ligase-like ATP-grasp enzyme